MSNDKKPTLPPNIGDEQNMLMAQKEKMVRIILNASDDIPPTGLFIQLNGRPWMLRPGEPAEVPEALVGVLDDAIKSVPVLDSNNNVVGYRDEFRYPYRYVKSDARG